MSVKGFKGFKVFNNDWTSASSTKDNMRYVCPGKCEVNATNISNANNNNSMYTIEFCEKLSDCFDIYNSDPNNKIAEVVSYGNVLEDGFKLYTDKLELVREIPREEVLSILANTGKCNTGCCNTGNKNTGNYNSGDNNTGEYNEGNKNTGGGNTGDLNTGEYNEGNNNTGDFNEGDLNTGSNNEGNKNTGEYNKGNNNTGYFNKGNCNIGNKNIGKCNAGNKNTGDWNTGDNNTGDWNAGKYNTGNKNTGKYNTGNKNTGKYNAGNKNTGKYNTGNKNTGDWNSSSFNSGFFNTTEPKIRIFNKTSIWTYSDWNNSHAGLILDKMPKNIILVNSSDMTEKEKNDYPDYTLLEGYLKVSDETNVRQEWWDNLSDSDKGIIKALPNFDAEIFKQITGIIVE